MALPDLSELIQICAQDVRCHGLIAFGSAVRDYPPPQAELGLLLLADHGEAPERDGAIHDDLDIRPGEVPIHLRTLTPEVFAEQARNPGDATWFLLLSEAVLLLDADGTLGPLVAEARAWSPFRGQRAALVWTVEFTRFLDLTERALDDDDLPAAIKAIQSALVALRRLNLLHAKVHPGSSFWGADLADAMARDRFFAFMADRNITTETVAGLAEELALVLEDALEELMPLFATLLDEQPEGLTFQDFAYLAEFEGLANYDLVIWRQHQRGVLKVSVDPPSFDDSPEQLARRIRVRLP
ncbi:MAG: hypothetical protein ABI743_11090 [bacterium]